MRLIIRSGGTWRRCRRQFRAKSYFLAYPLGNHNVALPSRACSKHWAGAALRNAVDDVPTEDDEQFATTSMKTAAPQVALLIAEPFLSVALAKSATANCRVRSAMPPEPAEIWRAKSREITSSAVLTDFHLGLRDHSRLITSIL